MGSHNTLCSRQEAECLGKTGKGQGNPRQKRKLVYSCPSDGSALLDCHIGTSVSVVYKKPGRLIAGSCLGPSQLCGIKSYLSPLSVFVPHSGSCAGDVTHL